MKDNFRYIFPNLPLSKGFLSNSRYSLACMRALACLIATLGSITSGFIIWRWLPAGFGIVAVFTMPFVFVLLWRLCTRIAAQQLPEASSIGQRLHTIFLSREGWGINWRFWLLIVFSFITAPTLFTLTIIPAIDKFNQQRLIDEKNSYLQKYAADYGQILDSVNDNIEDERDTLDLLVNEEDGEDIENINLAIKNLENLEAKKFQILQEFSQEDSKIRQLTLNSQRILFGIHLPDDIESDQQNFLRNQNHWKYLLLEVFCLSISTLLVIALFSIKALSSITMQQPKKGHHSITSHKDKAKNGLPITSLLSSNSIKPATSPQTDRQNGATVAAVPDKISLLRKERELVRSKIEQLKKETTADRQKVINELRNKEQNLSNTILKLLLDEAKTALVAHENETNDINKEKNTKELLNA